MTDTSADNVTVVFNGFLALSMKEKVRLVDVMNEFFDYPDRREQMRAANEELVAGLLSNNRDTICKCCRK
jgi:hypothetical protein